MTLPRPIKRLTKTLGDPEWKNYLRYCRRQGFVAGSLAPFGLALRLIVAITDIVLLRVKWHSDRMRQARIRSYSSDHVASNESSPSLAYRDFQKHPRVFVSSNDIEALVNYGKTELCAEMQKVVEEADAILTGDVSFFSAVRLFASGRMPLRGSYKDPEYLFYLNRWYHGVILAKAFAYTSADTYASVFGEMLEQWATDHRTEMRGPVWESYSVGERIVNWLFAHSLLKSSKSYEDRTEKLLLDMVTEHAEFLSRNLENRVKHNHLINNARALFIYGALCAERGGADHLMKQGFAILDSELERQFDRDGMLIEQSSHYHLLLLSRYAEVALLAERNGIRLPEKWHTRLKQMFEVANLFVRPDDSLVLIGDASPDIDPAAIVGVLSVGKVFFRVPSCVRPNEYALWFLGHTGLNNQHAHTLIPGLSNLSSSGHAVYKTENLHFVMRCQPTGEVLRHGHHDSLGLDLWVRGHSILRDPGNSSFNLDDWDRYFRGPRAHSVVIVDDLPLCISDPVWKRALPGEYTKSESAFIRLNEDEDRIVIEAQHTGYRRLQHPVEITRRVQIFGERALMVSDFLQGNGDHFVEIPYQFHSNNIELKAGNTLTIYAPTGETLAEVTFSSTSPLTFHVLRSTTSPAVGGWWSPGYGRVAKGTSFICSFPLKGEAEIDALFTFSPCQASARQPSLVTV